MLAVVVLTSEAVSNKGAVCLLGPFHPDVDSKLSRLAIMVWF